MKVIFVTVCAFMAAFAAPAQRSVEEVAAIRALPALEFYDVRDKLGQYALRYVTAEGIVVSERGHLVPNLKGDDYVLITEGETSYIGDDGKQYTTKFSAGIDGMKVESNLGPLEPNAPNNPKALEVSASGPVTSVS